MVGSGGSPKSISGTLGEIEAEGTRIVAAAASESKRARGDLLLVAMTRARGPGALAWPGARAAGVLGSWSSRSG